MTVDIMTVDIMTVDIMTVDIMTVDEMTVDDMKYPPLSPHYEPNIKLRLVLFGQRMEIYFLTVMLMLAQ